MKKMYALMALATLALASCNTVTSPAPSTAGESAAAHVAYLSEQIGPRVAGTAGELQASAYAFSQLQRLGLTPVMRPFEYTRTANGTTTTIRSQNVTALLKGESAREIIVVAHIDSVAKGRGADDNASSVGVLLEVAERLQEARLPYSVRFLIVGAEEQGLRGSRAYVAAMTDAEVANTQLVINLDSLLAGDLMYVYGEGNQGAASREDAIKWATDAGLKLQTQNGLNPEYPAGTTGDWSDHAPFKARGISYAYLEATNWNLGDKDGYTQTEKFGGIWHTDKDTLEFLRQEFPGRVEERLSTFTQVLEHMVTAPPAPLTAASLDAGQTTQLDLRDFEHRHKH